MSAALLHFPSQVHRGKYIETFYRAIQKLMLTGRQMTPTQAAEVLKGNRFK